MVIPLAICIKPILLAETPVKMRDTALSWRRLQSFCASTLQSLTTRVTFSTVSPLNLHVSDSSSWYTLLLFINNIISSATVFAGVPFVHQSGTNHAPGALVTQVNHLFHTLSTFLRIRACRSFGHLSRYLSLILSWCFIPSPSLLYQVHQQPQGSLRFSSATFPVFLVLGLCICFSFRFPSVRCFYLME